MKRPYGSPQIISRPLAREDFDCAEVVEEVFTVRRIREMPPCHLELHRCADGHLHLALMGHVSGASGHATAIVTEDDLEAMLEAVRSTRPSGGIR